jgi:hypothetical protein
MPVSVQSLERLDVRPAGRRHTTVAIYRSASAARSAVTKLHNMGLEAEKLSLIGVNHPAEGPAPESQEKRGAQTEDGLSALGAGLVRLGVSRDSALHYETDVSEGRTLLVVHGTLAEAGRAAELLEKTMHNGLAEHEG